VLLLVFESIGTQELALIVIAALMLFGPRKLPELGRMFGKSLAEFRRASEDFKRTWQMEVELEQAEKQRQPQESSTAESATSADETVAAPLLIATPADSIVARGRANSIGDPASNDDDDPPAAITAASPPPPASQHAAHTNAEDRV
jgi:TatA/E family protein of Tat protein translocase